MSFHDVQFPPVIARGASQGPSFSTQIVTTSGGGERRNVNWAQARRRYNVGTGLRTRADADVLLAFFHARQGRAFGFRFKDFSDFELPRQNIGTTNGSLATFQIFKRYTSGGVNHDRTITRPVSLTVRCWQNGTERTLGAGASQFQVNLTTGVITLGSTLAATTGQAVEVQCEFDVPCRFDTDDMSLAMTTFYNQEWADISIVEVRP
jgi:uncharacterized protein (TIGR02217 family)